MPSPPQNPTAGIPAASIAATSFLLTIPASTISATSRVSASVMRSPSTKSLCLAQLLQHAGQRAAAAVHHGDVMAVLRQLRNRLRALAQRREHLRAPLRRF